MSEQGKWPEWSEDHLRELAKAEDEAGCINVGSGDDVIAEYVEPRCKNCGNSRDNHVFGISGIPGCHNNSASTTYEP